MPGKCKLIHAHVSVLLFSRLLAAKPSVRHPRMPAHCTATTSAQVCELLAKNAWQQVADMKQAATPADPVSLPALPAGSGRGVARAMLASVCPGSKARRAAAVDSRHACCCLPQVDEAKIIEKMEKITTGKLPLASTYARMTPEPPFVACLPDAACAD